MTVSKVLNWIKWLIGALIVGGLGNGVWEKFLSPFISFISTYTIELFIDLSTRFSDEIYSKVAKISTPISDPRLSAIISVLFILMFAILMLMIFSNNKKMTTNSAKYKILLFAFIIILTEVLILSARRSYIFDIAVNSQKNLEIARPYIGESKYFQMRSNYLRITTKKDFDIYEEEVRKYSNEHNLNLKKFSD